MNRDIILSSKLSHFVSDYIKRDTSSVLGNINKTCLKELKTGQMYRENFLEWFLHPVIIRNLIIWDNGLLSLKFSFSIVSEKLDEHVFITPEVTNLGNFFNSKLENNIGNN